MEENILVIHLAFIGDVLLAAPTLRALRAAYPTSRITLLVQPVAAPVAEMNPSVDEVLVYDKRGARRGLRGMWRMAKALRGRAYTMAICMNFAVRGAALAWLARIPRRIGYRAQHAGIFLTDVVVPVRDGQRHESENQLDVLRPLRIPAPDDTSLALQVPAAAVASLRTLCTARALTRADRYIVICPIGSYAEKSLSAERTASLVRCLRDHMTVFLVGGRKESAALREIAQRAELPQAQVFGGDLTLAELAALIAGAALMITVDTGPLHIAQALRCPTIALFGPTDPHVWGPRGRDDIVLLAARVENAGPAPVGLAVAPEEIAAAALRMTAARGSDL